MQAGMQDFPGESEEPFHGIEAPFFDLVVSSLSIKDPSLESKIPCVGSSFP